VANARGELQRAMTPDTGSNVWSFTADIEQMQMYLSSLT
jgi:hypothetical protein